MNKIKFRTFVKTYLVLKGKSSANTLAEAFNSIGFEKHDVSSKQVGAFLRRECNKSTESTILHNLKFDVINNVKYYYLD